MDFKFKKENLTDTAVTVAGAVGLGLGSRVLANQIIGTPKSENTPKIVKGVLVLAGVLGAVTVQGNDLGANALRGGSVGMAVVQAIDLAKDLAKPEEATNKYVRQAFGLNACTTCGTASLRSAYASALENYTPSLEYTPNVPATNQVANPILNTIYNEY